MNKGTLGYCKVCCVVFFAPHTWTTNKDPLRPDLEAKAMFFCSRCNTAQEFVELNTMLEPAEELAKEPPISSTIEDLVSGNLGDMKKLSELANRLVNAERLTDGQAYNAIFNAYALGRAWGNR